MYSTCLFCQGDLGHNDVIETWPVGKRLAFDAARGRLWVVCPHCHRWNLTPLNERWEAIEACERLFRDSRLRVATGEIGLARIDEQVDLVRIGQPLLPEFAGWRYGRELRNRSRQDLLGGARVVGGATGVLASSIILGITVTPFLAPLIPLAAVAGTIGVERMRAHRVVARFGEGTRAPRIVRALHLRNIEFRSSDAGMGIATGSDAGPIELQGADAERLAAITCARRNRVGGTEAQVHAALDFLTERGGPRAVVEHIGTRGPFNKLWYAERLALEIALHEQSERLALEGELTELQAAWQEAEEIAGIADNLLLPPSVERVLERLRGG